MKFHSIEDNVTLNTLSLTLAETFVFVLVLTNYVWSWLFDISDWLELAIMALSLVFIIFEIAGYWQAKQIAKDFTIYIEDNAFGFAFDGRVRRIPWSDIKLDSWKVKGGSVHSIRIRTKFNQKIKIRGMEDMDALLELIKEKTEFHR